MVGMHPNVASDNEAGSTKAVCLCVSDLSALSGAPRLCAGQWAVAVLGVATVFTSGFASDKK